jgi:hypothetical protein
MKMNLTLIRRVYFLFLYIAIAGGCRGDGHERHYRSINSDFPPDYRESSRKSIAHVTDYKGTTDDKLMIFPVPSYIQVHDGTFKLDGSVIILAPQRQTPDDEFLSGLLMAELSDKYGLQINIIRRSSVPENERFILAGDISNPLVKSYCRENGLLDTIKALGEEGYIITISDMNVVVAAGTQRGVLYGFESLRQIIRRGEESPYIPVLVVKDSPLFRFRGIKLYLPGRQNIPFFKRFIRDFAAKYKFNRIILELNANMRLEKHPELNIGTVRFERYLNFSRLDRPPGLHNEFQNSSHQDNADGEILEKDEVADIVSYIRKFNIEVIPELPSLTHAYYLLFGHEDLAENLNQPYPDTYCPLKPEVYKIYFDVLDEYIAVIKPSMIHVGHDEWRVEKDICELCRGKDYGKLFAEDLTRIHDYLKGKGIRTAIWGDHLLESVRNRDHQVWKSSTGYEYKIPGALTPEQVKQLIPKDILIFNWFFNKPENDKQISDFGFQQVYGNFTPDINEWIKRITTEGLIGGAPSSWAATTETNFGKDQLMDFLGCANLLWSEYYLPVGKLTIMTEPLISDIYSDFRGSLLPSDAGSRVVPVDISSSFNSSLSGVIDDNDRSGLRSGTVRAGSQIFNLGYNPGSGNRAIVAARGKDRSGKGSIIPVAINKDVNSIIFLHATAKEGRNSKAYRIIHNFDDTSELLGWYEVIYDDGFVETIPVRYGMNILDWRWEKRTIDNEADGKGNNQNQYAYMARAVECSGNKSGPVSFFACEWENTRPGKTVRAINLKPAAYEGKNENAIILLAVSITENPKLKNPAGNE